MSIKLSDALSLSWKNIFHHKKRSITVIITITILFTTILAYSILVKSIEKLAISASISQTKSKIYLTVQNTEKNSVTDEITITNRNLSKLNLSPIINQDSIESIKKEVSEYNGKIVGFYKSYQLDFPYQIIDKQVAESIIDKNLWSDMPQDKIPVITMADWSFPNTPDYKAIKNRLENEIFKVGFIPSLNTKKITSEKYTFLVPLFQSLPRNKEDLLLFIDDGTGKIEKFIKKQIEVYLQEDTERNFFSQTETGISTVVTFDSPDDLSRYMYPGKTFLGIRDYREQKYTYQDLFGTTVDLISNLESLKSLFIICFLTLLLITIVITLVALSHIIEEDTPIITLYRAFGASTPNICIIYLLYLFELMILSVISIFFFITFFLILLVLFFSGTVSEALMNFYNLKQIPQFHFSIDPDTIITIIITILVVAPISLLLSIKQFSPKQIAKRLKED